ncbi:MAG: thrombospondin type 3 repeat-containing protein [Candidatus Peribacteraceae bacterium]|nr:thrombospondin type 3 repeat-containing protein [Candidatus Peribacteraceae bacterium]
MKKLSLALVISSVVFVPVALAAPLYERTIDVGALPSTQPVFIAVPETVLRRSPLESLRIVRGTVTEPIKSSPEKQGELRGIIESISLCSSEGTDTAASLHDGSTSTFARPDPAKNPSSCTITLLLATAARVDSVSFSSDQTFKTMTVSARSGQSFTDLRTVKGTTAMEFSSIVTDALFITITYDIVPRLSELGVNGTFPARILFMAEPGAQYKLQYGDNNPPAPPAVPSALVATSGTRYVTIGAEQTLQGDDDQDGVLNLTDNCRAVANPDQKDTDHDGLGDACDNAQDIPNLLQNDKDLDGVGDATDNCRTMFNPDQSDSDLNDIGDVCDDADKDGIVNSKDNCAGIANADQKDADGDGAGDACQLDRDSDGAPDTVDNCRSLPNTKQEDADQDNIGDSCDNCPITKNQTQRDENGNGIGDACEASIIDADSDGVVNATDNCAALPNSDQTDLDNDGVGDACDNCPTIQNQDQRDSDKNKQGDACTDIDADGLLPPLDNCPTVANADQTDANNNGIGDTCEDDDGDGTINATDNCRYKSNYNQQDSDADGIGDSCDETDDRLSEQHPWVLWIGTSFLVLVLIGISVRMVMKIRKEQGTGV